MQSIDLYFFFPSYSQFIIAINTLMNEIYWSIMIDLKPKGTPRPHFENTARAVGESPKRLKQEIKNNDLPV